MNFDILHINKRNKDKNNYCVFIYEEIIHLYVISICRMCPPFLVHYFLMTDSLSH